MKKLLILFSFMILIMAGCSDAKNTTDLYGEGDVNTPTEGSVDTTTRNDYAPIDQTGLPKEGDEVAVISTDLGDITIRFFPEAAPKAVENFKTHAKDGYYDNLIFHRVINDFMIQGGDPEGTGRGGESIWNRPFEDEVHPDLSNIRGALAMANAGPNTNGSQFFINQVNNSFLDGFDASGKMKKCGNGVSCHTVFGQVISGMDTVDKIAEVERDSQDKPLEDVKTTVKIVPYEEAAE